MARFRASHRLAMAVGTVALAALAVGCGDDDDDAATDTTESDDSGGGGGGGTLAICTDSPYEPFEFEEDGEFTGFDIELLRAVGEGLDMEIEPTDVAFDTILLSVESGDCDLVASAMTITEERQEQALFSDPYFDADQSLLVRAEDEESYPDLDSLEGGQIGTQCETTGDAYANENTPEGATVTCYPDAEAMFLALQSGEADALLQDLPVNAYRATQDDNFVVTATFPTGEQYGFAAALDNQELIDQVNEQLQALRDDGTYDTIYEEWFGEPPS